MIVLGVAATLLLTAVAPTSADVPPSPDVEQPVTTRATRPIVIQHLGLDVEGFTAALRLRLPTHPLIAVKGPRPKLFDFVIIDRVSPERTDISLITHEGAAYDRRIEVEEAQMVRTVASTLATLVSSIEAGDVLPDRTSVPIPPPPQPQPQPPPAPKATPKPTPVAPVPAPPPRLELSPTVDGAAIVGVAPQTGASSLAAGGGQLGIDARWRNGTVATLGVRAAGRAAGGLSLVRVRIAVGAGYAARWTNFELVSTAAATIEPWTVAQGSERARLELGRRAAATYPLVGGLIRVSPGVRLVPRGRSEITLRLGARIEAAGSFVTQDGARTADVGAERTTGVRTPLLRAGGFELAIGFELAAWFGVRDRRGSR